MSGRSLTIRNILWLTVGALTLVITLLVTQEIYTEWRKLQEIESLKSATSFSDKLFDATGKLSIERDIAFAMLHAPGGKDFADLQARLNDNRHEVDDSFDVVMSSMERNTFPEMAELAATIQAHWKNIGTLRHQIDKIVNLPDKQTKSVLATRWYNEVTELIAETQDLWAKFIKHYTGINPIVTQHLRYAHFLRIITDYTGRQRSLISRLLVENADATPQEIGQLLRWQGMLDLSWRNARMLADQSGLYETIGPSFKDAESQYLNLFDMVRDIFYVPGSVHGASYPIDINLWFELATQSTESLNALEDISRKAKQGYMLEIESDAKKSIFAHIFVLLFAFGLCLYCFWIINRRVIAPISAMVGALLNTMEGKSVSLAPIAAGQQDEIGKLVRVLHAFQQNVEEIRHYTRALERSNQDLEDFAHIASHDLKEPLHGLSKNSAFLLEDYRDKLDEDGVKKLHRLAALAQRMEQLISDLLYFSRLGRAELAIQDTDLDQTVSDIREMMESFLKEHNARIVIPVPMPHLVCDKPRTTEVLRNLITNAVKYNDKQECTVEVGFLKEANTDTGVEKNVVYVKDNGIGIKPEFHTEIFRLFKKLHASKEGDKSTGVGLTFVKKIVERHKGRVWLDSEPGKGSTFYFNMGNESHSTEA